MATNRERYAFNPFDSDSDSDIDDIRSHFRLFSQFAAAKTPVAEHSSDLDFAFNLQLQEALAASLAIQPPPPPPPAFAVSAVSAVAISAVARPFGEGSSRTAGVPPSAVSGDRDAVFRLFFKGLVEGERVGIGVAICDPRGKLIFEAKKPVFGDGTNRTVADVKALIEGLNGALALGLKRVVFYCGSSTTHNFVTGRWTPKQRKVTSLVNQVMRLKEKFLLCNPNLVPHHEIRYAIDFAREAIASQVENHPAESSSRNNPTENCVICSEDKDVSQIFSVNKCNHRYCVSCMRQHVEYRLRNALTPQCPHEKCESKLDIASCEKFLPLKFMNIMRQREKEATIPVAERVYCPYPKCSVLMSRAEVAENSRKHRIDFDRTSARKCVKCKGYFCINCKVPWHGPINCADYKRINPNQHVDDAKLKLLASMNLWSQCKKCNLVIELAGGCYHMKCRCGYEFCYKCGAEWKHKEATCGCPLWDERNIVEDGESDFEDEDIEEEDEFEYESDEEDIFYNADLGIYFAL